MEKKSIYAKRIEKVQMSSIRIVMEKVEKLIKEKASFRYVRVNLILIHLQVLKKQQWML